MSLNDVIGVFATGTYTVTRGSAGAYTDGDFVPGGISTFLIEASIQPLSGRDLQLLSEAQHGEEVRRVYTKTELRTVTDGVVPDLLDIDGEAWRVIRFERWEAFGAGAGGDHYLGFVARVPTP